MAICAGSAGLELGLKLVFGEQYTNICYIEREGFSAATLVARIQEKNLDKAPIWDIVVVQWIDSLFKILADGIECFDFNFMGGRWQYDSLFISFPSMV